VLVVFRSILDSAGRLRGTLINTTWLDGIPWDFDVEKKSYEISNYAVCLRLGLSMLFCTTFLLSYIPYDASFPEHYGLSFFVPTMN